MLPALRMARDGLGLNRSRLDLLEKLLACVPGETLHADGQGQLIVFASNARLAEMTHRSNDKAITRLLTELEGRGLLCRRHSPNGKRFARQGPDGSRVAYGIDIGPLLARMPEVRALAQAEAERVEACRRLREACSLMLSRLATREGLPEAALALLEEGRKALRRKPVLALLEGLRAALRDWVSDETAPVQAGNPAPSAPQTACHKDPLPIPDEKASPGQRMRLTPEMVERAMPRVAALGRQINGSLHDLVDGLRGYLGIGQGLWRRSLERLGFEESALLVMAIYERQRQVTHPPGYFAHLLKQGGTGPGSRLVAGLL